MGEYGGVREYLAQRRQNVLPPALRDEPVMDDRDPQRMQFDWAGDCLVHPGVNSPKNARRKAPGDG